MPPLLIVDLYPSLLQPEGDGGNARWLAYRARGLGWAAQTLTLHPGQDVPPADVFMLGGSADADLPRCAQTLRRSGVLAAAVERGAAVVGVGAGFSLLAQSFVDAGGQHHEGTGLIDVTMTRGELAAGPVVTRPNAALGLPALSGYEFHTGRARLGPGVASFAAVDVGVGNGADAGGPEGGPERGLEGGTEGAVVGRVLGTWLHGPLLPRNPEVADLILSWVLPECADQERRPGLNPGLNGGLDPELERLVRSIRARRVTEARLAS
ncbi:MAG TPA: glutamine amidotransferase [Actinomycetes bacterium]|nr:glutamine amidotransferase [Actinomycetes bacterium]